jgi:hypothetical protein
LYPRGSSTFFIKQLSEAISWIPKKTKLPIQKKGINKKQTIEIQRLKVKLDEINQ